MKTDDLLINELINYTKPLDVKMCSILKNVLYNVNGNENDQ